ncbi:MAG: response regulator [Deltaproteobacteria bacterium]|nr:response regulator [Deltaproteobacteria bacterium]
MKALVVDDNESLRKLFQLFLENMGFEAETAADGGEAFRMLQQQDYDFILSDMDMPFVNGMELYELIEKYLPELTDRVVFATGNPFSEAYQDFFERITSPVLYKPFRFVDLIQIVESQLGQSHGIAAPLMPAPIDTEYVRPARVFN